MKESLAETKFEKKRMKYINKELPFYHITDPVNIPSILEHGLKADEDGYIYLFIDSSIIINGVVNYVSDLIAIGQCFLMERYAMISIDPEGIFADIEDDSVGEISARWQFRIKQEKIDPFDIWLEGEYKPEFKPYFPIK